MIDWQVDAKGTMLPRATNERGTIVYDWAPAEHFEKAEHRPLNQRLERQIRCHAFLEGKGGAVYSRRANLELL